MSFAFDIKAADVEVHLLEEGLNERRADASLGACYTIAADMGVSLIVIANALRLLRSAD